MVNTPITVKGINGQLIFVINENIAFENVIQQLKSLLDKPLLKNNGLFPKALFDFKCRKITNFELEQLLNLLFEKQVVLFGGIVGYENTKTTNSIEVITKTVRSGQELMIDGDALLIGNINPGGMVKITGTLYVLGRISGQIEGIYDTSKINGQYFDGACIKINGVYRHEYTSLELSLLYYKDKEIQVEKGEMVYV